MKGMYVEKVKIAVIGLGFIGQYHLERITKLDNVEVSAVCDENAGHAKEVGDKYGCKPFSDYEELLESKIANAVLIATPHYFHAPMGIEAFRAGLHVLVEKPISVHKADCRRLIDAHTDKSLVFGAMFNQRTLGVYTMLKKMIDGGELGEIIRVNWIITDWFRTDKYYSSGSWRATWKGEGGGVLLNQCPHQLDLLQWLCGMPKKVRAFCALGKRHDIEVEDEVTAWMEFANGATGVFIASTGEAPGTNRLEICAENGKVTVENDKLFFARNEMACSEFQKTSEEGMAKPDVENIEIPINDEHDMHQEITWNFANAILTGEELIAPGQEGIHSVELANAMLYSSLTDSTVEMPLDGQAYEAKLLELINNSD